MITPRAHQNIEWAEGFTGSEPFTAFAPECCWHPIDETTPSVGANSTGLKARPTHSIVSNSNSPLSSLQGEELGTVVEFMINMIHQGAGEVHLAFPPLQGFLIGSHCRASSWWGLT